MTDQPVFRGGAPMVRWFNPRQLLATGANVVVSMVRSDFRVIEALEQTQRRYEYHDRDELWIDYVADLGDGFNPTYAVARLMAQESITVPGHEGALPGGDVMIMGGDQVYPVASRDAYRRRLRVPYEAAFDRATPRDLFALPGNHDWYDGLSSFMRQFCQNRTLGTLATQQRRSYFAIELPHDWWLLAIDIQLRADIDRPQMAYFAEHALAHMSEGDKVILCVAEPGWLYGDGATENKNLEFVAEQIQHTGAEVRLWMAGDLHYYMRHEAQSPSDKPVHKIISGGGGAFSHPTHGFPADESTPAVRYPDRETSRKLSLGNLVFFARNPWFGAVFGAMYVVLGAAFFRAYSTADTSLWNVPHVLELGCAGLLQDPFALFWSLLFIGACVSFSEEGGWFGWSSGIVHGATHIVMAMLTAWFAVAVVRYSFDASFPRLLGSAGFIFVIGGGLGLGVAGLYLTVSSYLFGRVSNNAFAGMRIQGYKNFVRMHLRRDGGIDIYSIGLERVPRKWRAAPEAKARVSTYEPADARATPPHLIEHISLEP